MLEESARLLYKEWFVHLRFPGHEHVRIKNGVPEGWKETSLNEICSNVKETTKPENVEANTLYIGLEHIPRRSITLLNWGLAEEVTSSKHLFKQGDILFGKIRPYFHKVGMALTDGITSSDAIVIRPLSHELFSLCLMVTSSDQFVAVASKTVKEGSKMPRADWKYLTNYPVLIPPSSLLEIFNLQIDAITSQLKTLAFQIHSLKKARDLLLPRLMNGEIAV